MIDTRRSFAALCFAALWAAVVVVLVSSGAALAATPTDTADASPAGPADVAIPFGDTASIEPQQPWRVASCADVRAASELVASCNAESIVLATEQYDPDAGLAVLPVELRAAGRTMTVQYRISLEAPPAPSARAVSGRAVAAGALLRVPFSEFSLTCTVCDEGGGTRVVEVDPAEAGSAWTTSTHVVFRASRDYRGEADIHVAFGDDYGTEGRTGVNAFVYPARDEVMALDVAVPVDGDGRAQVDLGALSASASGAEVTVVGCGAATHGSVTCDDGVATYAGGQVPDQFAFRVYSGADQAWGSVTLLPADGVAGPVATTRPAGDTPVAMTVVPPVPPEGGGESAGGLFAPFSEMLDRVGAR